MLLERQADVAASAGLYRESSVTRPRASSFDDSMRAARRRDGRRIEDILEREIDAKAFPQTRKHLRHRKRIRARARRRPGQPRSDSAPAVPSRFRPVAAPIPSGAEPSCRRVRRARLARSLKGGCQFAALDLSARALRDLRHNPDQARDLEPGQAFAGEGSELCALTLEPGRNTTAAATSSPSRLWGMEKATASTTSGWLSNASSTSRGRDLLTSRLMIVFDPANDEEISVAIQVSEVAGSKPAVPKRGFVGRGIVVVSPGDGRAPQRDLSAFAGWQPSALRRP